MSERGHTAWPAARLERVRTLLRLGIHNVARVGLYRIARRVGAWRALTPITAPGGDGQLLPDAVATTAPGVGPDAAAATLVEADEIISGRIRPYSGDSVSVGDPPGWEHSPYDRSVAYDLSTHWDAPHAGRGDIKDVWEASRFSWAPVLARAWRLSGDRRYLDALERWIGDWRASNQPNAGVNWECGQETSLRLLNTLVACEVAGPPQSVSVLREFVHDHVRRVAATTSYARAQDNNHGTSEGAGLFVGGAWLLAHGDARGRRYRDRGRRMLEERVRALVMPDGSFSQYSVNYHRVLLDTLCIVEWWRRRLDEPELSPQFVDRARAATLWLYEMVDPVSGDAPNIGANDGARLLGLSAASYRDYRPSVQLASALFCDAAAYEDATADEPLAWLGIVRPGTRLPARTSRDFEHGGWATLHALDGASWAAVRYPVFQFRPGHADALHLDLWHKGRNVLRDGGSFGYAASEPWSSYFPGTESHNTVQFDGRDQMPRIGRFLFGSWLRCDQRSPVTCTGESCRWAAGYTDARGATHRRLVRIRGDVWTVEDSIAGRFDEAILRWRLAPGEYRLEDGVLSGEGMRIELAGVSPQSVALVQGWESRLYHVKTPLPVLQVKIDQDPAVVRTTIDFADEVSA